MGASASIENPDTVWELVNKIKTENPGNRCTKYLTKEYYDSLSPEQQAVFQKCVRTGIDNPTSGLGCYAMQPSDYETFGAFFDQVSAFKKYFCCDHLEQVYCREKKTRKGKWGDPFFSLFSFFLLYYIFFLSLLSLLFKIQVAPFIIDKHTQRQA